VLTAGALYLLYLTPAYRATLEHPTLHHLVHLHVLVSGYLFCWVVAGPDPGPRRAPVPVRLLVLGVAVVGQTVLSQLISADVLVDIAAPAGQRRAGAALMHYGGDLVQLLLALAVVATWRPARSSHFADKAV
jgi:putative membrane protein